MSSLVRNVARLQWPFEPPHFWHHSNRRFKVHDLITCESKVQVVVSLGRHEGHEVLFALGRHEDLTHDTWHALLQSENVVELGGITMWIGHRKEIRKLTFRIRSDEGLTLETSAFESLHDGQFTLSTQLMKPNYLVIFPSTQHHSFVRNLPLYSRTRKAGERQN